MPTAEDWDFSVAPYLRKHPGRSGFWLLGDGLDAYDARMLLADALRIVNAYANRGFRAIETLARFDAVTLRRHNRSFGVDDTITNVGGRNVGDEYCGVHENANSAAWMSSRWAR